MRDGETSIARGSLLDGTLIVSVSGSFDAASGGLLERELVEAELEGVDLILHVLPGSYVDAAGVAAIGRTAAALRRRSAQLVLVSADPRIERLASSASEGAFRVFGTLNAAVDKQGWIQQ